MNFYKVKRIAVKMDGTIVCQCVGCEVKKSSQAEYWTNEYNEVMTPLFDIATGDIAGFFNAECITITSKE